MKASGNIQVATEVLQKLASIYGMDNVVLAGGAIRDMYFDVPVKDYDYVIQDRRNKGISYVDLTRAGLIDQGGNKVEYLGTQYGGHSDRGLNVYQFKYRGETIQLLHWVGLLTPSQIIMSHFDIGLCMCWYNLRDGFTFSPHFKSDESKKRLTIYTKNISGADPVTHKAQMKRSLEHADRLTQKYPRHIIHTI